MSVVICDVGPRDGLQNESMVLPAASRAALIDRLALSGLKRIECVSFVNPRLVPAMAEPEDVMNAVSRRPGVRYSALAMNLRGYERALAAGMTEIRYGFAATDEFGLRNQNRTAQQGVEAAIEMIKRARQDGVRISIAISTAFGCPFAGPVAPASVLKLVEQLADEPPDEVSLADTIGVAVPPQVRELVAAIKSFPSESGVHFHDTRNTGVANSIAAVEAGADVIDASVGGTGGCPFAPRATGNVATEDVVFALHRMGVDTGIDLDSLIDTALWLGESLGKTMPSALSKAGPFPATLST